MDLFVRGMKFNNFGGRWGVNNNSYFFFFALRHFGGGGETGRRSGVVGVARLGHCWGRGCWGQPPPGAEEGGVQSLLPRAVHTLRQTFPFPVLASRPSVLPEVGHLRPAGALRPRCLSALVKVLLIPRRPLRKLLPGSQGTPS